MERTLAAQLSTRVGDDVHLRGWLHRVRRLASVTFVVLRDRSGLAQIVVDDPALAADVSRLVPESVLEVRGKAVASRQAPAGVEVVAAEVRALVDAVDLPPVELHRPVLRAALPTILDHAAVTLRHPRQRAVFELAAASLAGFRATLDRRGFTEIQTPKIVASATESGANVFRIGYFGRPAFLAQSPQFYKQTMVGVFERVYETGPVFRAEPHDTTRHLAEYVSLDAEIGFIEDHRDVMDVVRDVAAGMVSALRERAPGAVDLLALALPEVPEPIPALHFHEAMAMLSDATGRDLTGEPDLAPEHERWLGDWTKRESGSQFLFVTGYPMAKRPFYTQPEPGRPAYSNSFDLLFRGMEIVTGGQRLHRYEDYIAVLTARGERIEPYEGYLEAFRHGMPPHGGFAMGLERWVAQLAGASNVRETTLFPRDLHRLSP